MPRFLKYISFQIIFFTGFVFSQNTGNLRVFISDSLNGEALAYCNVFIEESGKGASANEKGYAVITSIAAGKKYTLLVTYVGYESKKIDFVIMPNKLTELKIELNPVGIQLQTIEKIGEKTAEANATDAGLKIIKVRDLEYLPQSVELDIFRAIQSVPGVQSTSDISAKYYVRGGGSDQNLVLLNGAAVYNPFHAFGIFSAVDPEMINNIEFYKGGFTSEYGGRISSVMNLITKNGNKNRFSGSA